MCITIDAFGLNRGLRCGLLYGTLGYEWCECRLCETESGNPRRPDLYHSYHSAMVQVAQCSSPYFIYVFQDFGTLVWTWDESSC